MNEISQQKLKKSNRVVLLFMVSLLFPEIVPATYKRSTLMLVIIVDILFVKNVELFTGALYSVKFS